jgi:hypothetical protein
LSRGSVDLGASNPYRNVAKAADDVEGRVCTTV